MHVRVYIYIYIYMYIYIYIYTHTRSMTKNPALVVAARFLGLAVAVPGAASAASLAGFK